MKIHSYSFTSPQLTLRENQSVLCRTPENVWGITQDLTHATQEMGVILTLNAKHWVIDRHLITLGLVNCNLMHPREIFRRAILDNASAIIVVHNHPSGDPAPSAEDIAVTRQLIDAGKIIDIQVLDHVIIGHEPFRFASMREAGLGLFS